MEEIGRMWAGAKKDLVRHAKKKVGMRVIITNWAVCSAYHERRVCAVSGVCGVSVLRAACVCCVWCECAVSGMCVLCAV